MPAPLLPQQLQAAVKILSDALANKNVQFGIVGGAACSLLSLQRGLRYRGTADIDLIVAPNPEAGVDASSLSEWLYEKHPQHFARVDQYGVGIPAVRLAGHNGHEVLVEVEMFDAAAWPNRPQYNLGDPENDRITLTVGSARVPILSPRWLLREKILSQFQRQGSPKELTDIRDIETLANCVGDNTLLLDKEDQLEAFNALLKKRPDLANLLHSKITLA